MKVEMWESIDLREKGKFTLDECRKWAKIGLSKSEAPNAKIWDLWEPSSTDNPETITRMLVLVYWGALSQSCDLIYFLFG